ncbi:MAG: hypothetical protein GX318_01915 [Clostridia bacterium]|nr:hypothetical protein [Clostridia bacterium]
MNSTVKEFRDGIFALRTRRFGTVAELMIETLFQFNKARNQFHDRYDDVNNKRVEIKFSTVMKENSERITASNIIEQCIKANVSNRAMKSTEIETFSFDCNIQQVKRVEFDVLYYGLFFADQIAIFKTRSSEIQEIPGYSDFQHKGNEGEGQFHINQRTMAYHFDNKLIQWLTYEELYNLFKSP